jgi:hypothetical protein
MVALERGVREAHTDAQGSAATTVDGSSRDVGAPADDSARSSARAYDEGAALPERVPRVSKGWPGRGLEIGGGSGSFQGAEQEAERHLSRIETSRLQLFPNTPEGHYAEITCAAPLLLLH